MAKPSAPSATSSSSSSPSSRAKAQRRERLRAALARLGCVQLRGLQGPALRSVLGRRDTVVLLPTGGGKSLCYQLPSLLLPGLVVVVCPLLALMQDQVRALRRRGIGVEMLSSLVSEAERQAIHTRLLRQHGGSGSSGAGERPKDPTAQPDNAAIELLYTTPETLATTAVRDLLAALYRHEGLALFAVDEAHCISAWGHDFRPAYRCLGALREAFPAVPFMALTATATPDVRRDIHAQLRLRPDANELVGDFNRPNIAFSVCDKDQLADPLGALARFITTHHRDASGVVYVHRRADVDALVLRLRDISDEGITVAGFHAKIPQAQRAETLQRWLDGHIRVICATIAFGMGIDHPSVRFVVHWNLPKSLENLYQEAGRAGRDGLPSQSVVFYSSRDYELHQFLIEKAAGEDDDESTTAKEKMKDRRNKGQRPSQRREEHALRLLDQVKNFATRKECRRQALLRYFGQVITVKDCERTCDVCNPQLKFFRYEPTASSLDDVQFRKASYFAKQSMGDLENRERYTEGSKVRSKDARRDDLIRGRAGAYVPKETTSVVVRDGTSNSLAASGFVAVNGGSESDDDDMSGRPGDANQFVSALVLSGKRRHATIESKLDALERAEQELSGSRQKRARTADGSRARDRLASKLEI